MQAAYFRAALVTRTLIIHTQITAFTIDLQIPPLVADINAHCIEVKLPL